MSELSLSELEQRQSDINSELERLAVYSLRGGTGSVSYQSQLHPTPDAEEFIRIELGEEVLIDQIVLVPSLWRESRTGHIAEGFPLAFRIIVGTSLSEQVIVANRSQKDGLLPRIAPLSVDFPPVRASWVSIEATTLSPRIMNNKYLLQLSEIMVFSGMENVALGKNVAVSSQGQGHWPPQFLTDGFTPYLMDAARGDRSQTQVIRIRNQRQAPSLTLDLKAPFSVNQINLHTADVALSIPMKNISNWSVPSHIRVSGAKHSDFSDEVLLFEHKQETIYDTGPIIMRRFPETMCRYIRITILNPMPVDSPQKTASQFAFSEIEVLSKGKNTALNAPVTASSNLIYKRDTLRRITDGLNYYGNILPIREWMNQLARRHDLEHERPLIATELNTRYEHQKANLNLLAWLAALLTAVTIISILVERLIHQRKMAGMCNRFAADLHDELGANLHVIGLLGDLAQAAAHSPEKLQNLHNRIRTMTERSGIAVREFTNILEADGLYGDLLEDMQRSTERIMADIEGELTFEGEPYLRHLKPRTRVDLFLFYKEGLVNISRHSGATKFSAHLAASPRNITLTITDNGHGMVDSVHHSEVPPSLKRRARLLRAKVYAESSQNGGTQILMILRLRNRRKHHETKTPSHVGGRPPRIPRSHSACH
ncbi:histidine kinase [Pontiellaceae bacterium B1224]|nr:histidine kinase [Pontiellaceae bacterium B1224]